MITEHLTDIIVLTLLSYYFLRGMIKGFLRTLLGPIALFIGLVASYVYYFQTHKFFASLLISIIGPILLHIIFSVLLKFWNNKIKDKQSPSALSRLAGGTFSLFWRGSVLLMIVTLLALTPWDFSWFAPIRDNARSSKTYAVISRLFERILPSSPMDINAMTALLDNPDKLREIKSTREYQNVMRDKKMRELFNDEQTMELIRDKNYVKLVTNDKILAIMKDEDLLKKLLALNNVMAGRKSSIDNEGPRTIVVQSE